MSKIVSSNDSSDKSVAMFIKQGLKDAVTFKDSIIITNHIERLDQLREPCRISALSVLVCLDGVLECSINLDRHRIHGTGVVVNLPENIVSIHDATNLDAYALILSEGYLSSQLQFGIQERITNLIKFRRMPFFRVPKSELVPLKQYYRLMKEQCENPSSESSHIMDGLIQAFLFQIVTLGDRYVTTEQDNFSSPRATLIFERFMKLLATKHREHRSVKYYAESMCLSPSHLSTVVKRCSGKTVSQWIDDYVIIDAKSLLRFSDMSVQEIAYRLNFPTQSAFGKFFKDKTSMAPSVFAAQFK